MYLYHTTARTSTAGARGVDEGSQCGVRGGVAFVLRVATGAGFGVAGGVGGAGVGVWSVWGNYTWHRSR